VEETVVRVLRWAAVLAAFTVAATVAVVAACQQAAGAHGGAAMTIRTDGGGSVWVTAQWEDGHAITDPVAAVLTANPTAGGTRIGPVPLRALHDEAGTLALPDKLGPGEWSVVADMASPAIGHCEATVRVAGTGASPSPGETRCGGTRGPARAAGGEAPSARPVALIVVGVGMLIAAGVAILVIRQRPRPERVPSRARKRR
jgi:hypothetical protein